MAKPPYRFRHWPFEEDEIVRIHWIASPVINPETGSKTCNVYFLSSKSSTLISVEAQWGALPEFWIGRRYQNGAPIDNSPPLESPIVIRTSYVVGAVTKSAANAIPATLYSLFSEGEICTEKCICFQYQGANYIIPCMELARVLYARNSVLANQLLSTGGLMELIDVTSWRIEDKKLFFDFSESCKAPLSGTLAEHFVSIYSLPALKNGWEHTYTQYVAKRKICTRIPFLQPLTLYCSGITLGTHTLLTTAKLLPPNYPFSTVDYGPEQLRRTKQTSDEAGAFETERLPESIEIAEPALPAKKTAGITIQGADGTHFRSNFTVSRRTTKSDSEPTVRRIVAENSNNLYTPNDQVGTGKVPFVNIEPANTPPLIADPDFTDFCNAINRLSVLPGIAFKDISYGYVPLGKTFSHLDIAPNPPRRRYACAELEKFGKRWTIIELCRKDYYSISTLLVQSNNDTSELIEKILKALQASNGHWTTSGLKTIGTCCTLDHHHGRDSNRWAQLFYNKMHCAKI